MLSSRATAKKYLRVLISIATLHIKTYVNGLFCQLEHIICQRWDTSIRNGG